MKTVYDYDKRGVRAFVKYSEGTGKWGIECYRKQMKEELEQVRRPIVEKKSYLKTILERFYLWRKPYAKKGKMKYDWQMIRVGHIISYYTREEAEKKALELAEVICEEFKL